MSEMTEEDVGNAQVLAECMTSPVYSYWIRGITPEHTRAYNHAKPASNCSAVDTRPRIAAN
jgi:hypothetical protein